VPLICAPPEIKSLAKNFLSFLVENSPGFAYPHKISAPVSLITRREAGLVLQKPLTIGSLELKIISEASA
jgi:hypothetical protein